MRQYPEGQDNFDITRLGDNYRSMTIIKSNLSVSNIEISLYFDGACSDVKELPRPEEMSEKVYQDIENKTFSN